MFYEDKHKKRGHHFIEFLLISAKKSIITYHLGQILVHFLLKCIFVNPKFFQEHFLLAYQNFHQTFSN